MMFVPLEALNDAARSNFAVRAAAVEGAPLQALSIDTVQVNIGLRCNLACRHCHVESSPQRTEEMDWETMGLVLDCALSAGAQKIDITGGAPELHPRFREFITAARSRGLEVVVRTNLTVLLRPDYEDLPELFRTHRVRLVASLPCYLERNVDQQRGKGAYTESVEAILRLNATGYGLDPELSLDLVYNPLGPHLPPSEGELEAEYRRELEARFGIRFTRLIAMANMPIGRFYHDLARRARAGGYMELLRDAFNPATLPALMCRHQIHVGWDGTLYDCDFNFALGLPVRDRAHGHVRDFDPARLVLRRIATGGHCFGCTAGRGSSCGGALR